MPTRRTMLRSAAAFGATLALPRFALSEIAMGGATLTIVSDGNLVLPGSMIGAGLPEEELAGILAEYGLSRDRMEPPCNVTLLRDGTNTVLFDVGAGSHFMPSAGKLLTSLDAAGVAPEEITHVVFTHAHPDHLWGLLDDFDDPMFPDAAHYMGRTEWDYWWNPETVETIGAERASFAAGAKRRMEAMEDRFEFFDDGEEVLPGVAAVATHGHTPGHMSFEINRGGDPVMIVGDAIGNHHIAFRRPGWLAGSDQDAETGAATRAALIDRVAQDRTMLIGFHFGEGGIGRAERGGDGFRFVPDAG
ncbi:metallo-beta-lactamase [Oceanicola sp. 22II-s10i]|uniref:MBL fold metallo-hydrolase n=1 Tax=Oceanicola sp. 22II-s10i TaxID=1317116 RepID=UPI000B6D089F|nr:MBL fold metallo-hydrolase [Oceanicola sp. 22II-s10i]OWU83453.1 metallo-beta-lactamase [Oceanicola sp. 22II-s10i]